MFSWSSVALHHLKTVLHAGIQCSKMLTYNPRQAQFYMGVFLRDKRAYGGPLGKVHAKQRHEPLSAKAANST